MNWTGLAALAWDPSMRDNPSEDCSFLMCIIKQEGGAVLDVGCGTGRLLLPFFASGWTVDGVDTSAEMLAICHEKAAARGLREPVLVRQALQRLDLPKRYRVIYISCCTFCLITERSDAHEALRRVHAHLVPGGVLVFNTIWPFGPGAPLSQKPIGGWKRWRRLWEHRLEDGSQIKQLLMRTSLDLVEQYCTAKRRYQHVRGGRIVAEEVFQFNERWYYKHEMVLMLEKAGFADTQIRDGWTDAEFAGVRDNMVFVARK